ncbi:MAG: TolC family protein [Bacteroidota bacterium]
MALKNNSLLFFDWKVNHTALALAGKIWLLWLIFPLSIQAQQVQTLTLDQAVKLGLEYSKMLKLSRGRLATYEARTKQTKAAMIPVVSLNSSYTRLSNNITPFTVAFPGATEPLALNPQILNQYNNSVSVSEPLFSGFRMKNAAESAKYLERASQLDYEKDKSEVVLNIANAYYNLYKIDASRKLVQENILQLNEQITNIQNFEKQGLAISNDVLRSQLLLSNIELSQIDVNNNFKVASYNLGIMLGLPTGTQIMVDTVTLFAPKTMESLDNYLQQAISNRKDLKAADMRSQSSLSNVAAAKSNYYPSIYLNASYLYNRPNARVFPQQDQFKDTWAAGITLSYNLTNLFTNKNQVAEATSVALQNQVQSDQLSDNIRMEVNQNFLSMQQAHEKIEVAKRSVAQANENYRTTQSRYTNGVALLTDLLDANVLRLQAQINYETARADAELAYQRLQKAIGADQLTINN